MLDSGPYRILRQILAQSEKKRTALKEAIYKIELKKVKYQQLLIEMDNTLNNDLEYRTLDLKSRKILSDIVDSQPVIEASMKELGALKRRYEEVIKNNNIPVNWDEQDFEDAEIEHHIRSIFRNGIRDRMQGSHNMGTMEYMEQFGINPITAYAFIDKYIHDIRDCISDGRGADITSHYIFYDKMYEVFKDEYKKASARIGLDNITQADFLMKEIK